MRAVCLSLFFLATLSVSAEAQQLTGKPYIDMDYGPFLSMTIEADGPGRNIAYKGVMVTLDEETQTYALFDEDLMRVVAAWTGGKINWRSVIYDGSHGTHPAIVGQQLFGNSVRPGWSTDGNFDDPRERPYGPLPHKDAHYKGLYLHDGRVVFKYTVGNATVLEMPGLERVGAQPIVTRTIEVSRSASPLTLQVAEVPDMAGSVVADGRFAVLGDLGAEPVEVKAALVPNKGLIGRWQIDSKSGSRIKLGGAKVQNGRDGQVLAFNGRQQSEPKLPQQPTLGGDDFSIAGWVRTKRGGTIAALASPGQWSEGGKSLFVRDGKLTYDIGWVGAVSGKTPIADGQWHHVGLTHAKDGNVQLFVDGKLDGRGRLESVEDPEETRLVFGQTSNNFPRGSANKLRGELDDICIYDRVLSPAEFAAMSPGPPPAGVTAATAVGMPDGATWKVDDGNLRLHIPAAATPARFKVAVWNGIATDFDRFKTAVANSPAAASLQPMTKGGPSRFQQTLTTVGKVAQEADKAYVIDELVPPTKNPWQSWLRFGGFDFFDDPTKAAICTWNGDVWIVSGINDTLNQLTWKRIATGMFQPLGLKIVDGDIYVCCRDQITILRDLNGDGEADFYENFNNDHQVTEHFHEFAMDLQSDANGDFYYAKSARHALDSVVPHHGTLIKVAKDGRSSEIVCNGFRAANGVGIGPNGELSTSDQEGHWTPANRINLVRKDGFYGNMYSFHRGERPTGYDPPVVWLPKNVDRSPAESLWVTSNKWGPLSGNLISTSYGTGQVFLIPYEQAGEVYQGGAIRFPLDFPTGTMRARFHPTDGQLYICGLFGWSSNKTRPGGFYRVRYTGKPAHMPVDYHVAKNGIKLTFSEPLDKTSAKDPGNYGLQQWNYRWTKNYGSKHWKVSDPNQQGADSVPVRSVSVLPDGKSVFLEIEDLQTVMQMQISWSLKDAKGNRFSNEMHATINVLGEPFDVDRSMTLSGKIAADATVAPGLILKTETIVKDPTVTAYDGAQLARPSRLARGAHTMLGYLNVRQPGQYSFRASANGGSKVFSEADGFLKIDGEQFANQPIALSRGLHQFWASLDKPAVIEWKSGRFDWEPIPPSALKHNPTQHWSVSGRNRIAARRLFAESGCIRCHTARNVNVTDGMPELSQDAPSLADAGTRFKPEWLRDWILNPKSIRPDTNMPQVLHGVDSKQDAMDIAAYLSTLGSPDDVASTATEAQVQAGGDHFLELGCVACHRTTPVTEKDEYEPSRRSLNHVDKKYTPGALARFLQAPHKHHRWRRMPNFQLTEEEAGSLASMLRGATPDAGEFEMNGDPRQGRILFGSVGCANCHSIDDQPPRAFRRGLQPKASGCLATEDSKRGDAPDFGFTPDQATSLVSFVRDHITTINRHIPADSAERAIEKLNCTACHTRDDQRGRFSEIYLEEGDGKPAEPIPPLTWAGEKFKTGWMAKFISGENKDRLRPHLKIRMPRFGAYGKLIAHGLAQQHGIDPAETLPATKSQPNDLAIGRRLVARDGGFNCTQCHGVGNQKPTAAFDALGVNLEQIPARIRKPFYDRWMMDPPRIDISTKMIKLATEGKTSIRDVHDGDAKKQFDAIWTYLRSLER